MRIEGRQMTVLASRIDRVGRYFTLNKMPDGAYARKRRVTWRTARLPIRHSVHTAVAEQMTALVARHLRIVIAMPRRHELHDQCREQHRPPLTVTAESHIGVNRATIPQVSPTYGDRRLPLPISDYDRVGPPFPGKYRIRGSRAAAKSCASRSGAPR